MEYVNICDQKGSKTTFEVAIDDLGSCDGLIRDTQNMGTKDILWRGIHSIFFQFLFVAVALWIYHWISPFIIEHYNIRIQITPETAPIYKRPDMDLNSWIVLPIIAFGIYLFLLRAILKAKHPIPIPILLALFMGIKVMIDVSVTMVNGHFLPLGIAQYYADVPKFDSVGDILRDYVSRAETLTTHSATHPPGPVLTLWLVTHLFNYSKMVKAFLIIISAPLSLIPMYFLAGQLHDRKIAFYTLALYLVTPNIVLYSATCMDAFFAVFLILSIYLFFYSLKKRSKIPAVLTGLSLSVSMFLTFATTFLGVYFIALTISAYFGDRRRFRKYLTTLVISGVTFCIFHLIIYWGTGYNILACLRGAIEIDEKGGVHHPGMGTGYDSLARYLFLTGTNLFAFLSATGLPSTTLWLRDVRDTVRNMFLRRRFSVFLLAYVVVLLAIAFSTLYTAETERIWMFMAPFVLIPAARNLSEYVKERRNERMFYVIVSMLFIQTLVFEIFIDTVW